MLLANIGGLIGGMISALNLIVEYVNRQFMIGKLIRNLYFRALPHECTDKNQIQKTFIKFDFKIKMSQLRKQLYMVIDFLLCKKLRKNKVGSIEQVKP